MSGSSLPARRPAAEAGAEQCPIAAQHDDCGAEIRELYLEHSPMLVRQLARRTGCVEIARELTQEAFVRLLRLAPAKLRSIERPDAFLRHVSANLLRDWARSRSIGERLKRLAPPAEPAHDQLAALESRDTLRRLEMAIGRMKPRTREIFLAHRIEGLTYAQIAVRTGLTVKGVEKQMSKAIAKIDRFLDRD
jgi:RNA polymerase sigma factor (sigma-70 family)